MHDSHQFSNFVSSIKRKGEIEKWGTEYKLQNTIKIKNGLVIAGWKNPKILIEQIRMKIMKMILGEKSEHNLPNLDFKIRNPSLTELHSKWFRIWVQNAQNKVEISAACSILFEFFLMCLD